MEVERNPDGTIKKGSCLNPGGRVAGVKQRAEEACRKHGVDPLDFFASVLADTSAARKDRISCAIELSNRLYGKAQQFLEIDNKVIDIVIRDKHAD